MASSSRNLSTTTVEATVTSKGQITLPRELRRKMGIQTDIVIAHVSFAHGVEEDLTFDKAFARHPHVRRLS